jgi:hypothetical protein
LLVPMRDVVDYQLVNGLQRINADSEKKFLTGSKGRRLSVPDRQR